MPDHERTRKWLSAFRDSEAENDAEARAHLDACEHCQAWAASLDGIDVAMAAALPAAAPDVTGAALEAWRREQAGTVARARLGRLVLAVAGVGGLVVAALTLAVLDDTVAASHYARDLLGFQVAFSVGFLLCGWNPARYVRALLPLTGAAVLAVGLHAAAGLATAGASLLVEASHLPLLAGLFGLFLLLDTLPAGPRRRVPTIAS